MTTDVAAAVVNRRFNCICSCMMGTCPKKCPDCEFDDERQDVVLAYVIALDALNLADSLGMPGRNFEEFFTEESEDKKDVDSV